MARAKSVRRPLSRADRIDAVFFTFSAFSATWLALLLLREGVRPGWPWLLLVAFWVFVSYLLLPRLHRILTRLYLPDYFIGRTRTSDGLLGDPINLALLGDEDQIHATMAAAGWRRADEIDLASTRRIIASTLRRRSYPTAPVSPLLLFGRPQDFAYQQEVAGSPSKRHHVRFWRCPAGWLLPGGHEVDWLAAGTYDRRVGLSLFTLQVTHKIDADTDVERDFVVASVQTSEQPVTVRTIASFSTGYHSRNGGGDLIETDGDLPVIDVRKVYGVHRQEQVTDSRQRRPAQTVFGAAMTFARGLGYLFVGVVLVLASRVADIDTTLRDAGADARVSADVLVVLGVLALVAAALDGFLAWHVLAGHDWARLWLMGLSVVTSTVAFVGSIGERQDITLASLPAIGASVLVLMALSSHRARDYAHHGRVTRAPAPATTS